MTRWIETWSPRPRPNGRGGRAASGVQGPGSPSAGQRTSRYPPPPSAGSAAPHSLAVIAARAGAPQRPGRSRLAWAPPGEAPTKPAIVDRAGIWLEGRPRLRWSLIAVLLLVSAAIIAAAFWAVALRGAA